MLSADALNSYLISTLNLGFAYCCIAENDKQTPDFTFLEVNSAFEKAVNIEALKGKNASDIFTADDADITYFITACCNAAFSGTSITLNSGIFNSAVPLSFKLNTPEKGYFTLTVNPLPAEFALSDASSITSNQFNELFYNHPNATTLTRLKDGVIIEANRAFLQIAGRSRENVIGKPTSNNNIWADQNAKTRLIERLRDEIIVNNFETEAKSSTGEIKNVMISARLLDFDGDECILISGQDFTKIRQAERAALMEKEKFRNMFQSHSAIMLVVEPASGRIIDANTAAVQFYKYSREKLLSMLISEINVLTPDEVRLEREKAVMQKRNHFIFPHRLANGEMRTVEVHSSPIVEGENIYLFSIVHDITERRMQEMLIAENEERFRNMFAKHSAIMLLIDPDNGNIIDANRSAETFYGYSVNKLCTMQISDINTFPQNRIKQILNEAKEKRDNRIIAAHRLANGTLRTVEINVSPFHFNDKIILFAIINDITARIKAEETLRENELKYHSLFENMQEAFSLQEVIFDENDFPVDFRFLETNKAFKQHTGLEPITVIGKTIKELKPDVSRKLIYDLCNAAIKGTSLENEYFFEPLNRYLKVRVFSPRRKQFAAIFEDVTELVNSRRELEMLSYRNEKLLQTSADGIHIITMNGDVVEVNEAFCKMLGYSREEALQLNVADWDRKWNKEELLLKIQELISVPGIFETKHKRKDGSEIDVEINSIAVSLAGKTLLYSSARDITEKNRARNEISKLLLAVENAPVSIVITDTDGNIEYVNPTFSRLTGYSKQEILGNNSRILNTGYTSKEEYAALWNTILAGQTWRGEFLNKKKNGEKYWELASISPVFDEYGKIINFVGIKEDITGRKLAQESLAQSEERLREVLENSLDAPYKINLSTNKYEYLSPAFIGISGYTPEEFENLSPDFKEEFILPEFRRAVDTLLTEALLTPKDSGYEIDYQIIHKNGSHRWVHNQFRIVKDANGIPVSRIGSLSDITLRKMAEEELHITGERLLSILENTTDVIAMMDTNFRYIAFNGAFLEEFELIYGKKPSVGDSLPKLLSHLPEDFSNAIAFWSRALDGEDFTVEQEFGDADEQRKWYELHFSPIRNKEGVIGSAVHIVRDITDRKKTQEQMALANLELQKLNTDKDKFFSILAHDLRSPFTGLLGLTEIMASENGDLSAEEIANYSKSLHRTAVNIYKLIENLLEWARFKQNAISFAPAQLNLREVTDKNIDTINERAVQKGISVFNEIPARCSAFADEKMLNTIFRNLLSNAVKFTRSGGTVTARAQELHDGMLLVSVSDTGIGLDNELAGKLFKIGEKVHTIGTDNEPSSGLGLILCKEFVEKHSGTIWVESKKGEGSTFYFTIPLEEKK